MSVRRRGGIWRRSWCSVGAVTSPSRQSRPATPRVPGSRWWTESAPRQHDERRRDARALMPNATIPVPANAISPGSGTTTGAMNVCGPHCPSRFSLANGGSITSGFTQPDHGLPRLQRHCVPKREGRCHPRLGCQLKDRAAGIHQRQRSGGYSAFDPTVTTHIPTTPSDPRSFKATRVREPSVTVPAPPGSRSLTPSPSPDSTTAPSGRRVQPEGVAVLRSALPAIGHRRPRQEPRPVRPDPSPRSQVPIQG